MTVYEQLNSLSGVEFEKLCASLVAGLGFQIEMTKASGDGGIDIIATKTMPLYRGKYIIQCKRYTGSVGEPILRDLYGVVMAERANKGILMTTGTFTRSAVSFADGKPLELIDISGIESLLNNANYNMATAVNTLSIPAYIDSRAIQLIMEKTLEEGRYSILQETYESNPSDISARGELGLCLFDAATSRYNLGELTHNDQQQLLSASANHLQVFSQKDIDRWQNKETQLQAFVCVWCAAHANFLLGNMSEAAACYHRALDWNDLIVSPKEDNGLLDFFVRLLLDVAFFYSIIGNKEQAERLITLPEYKKLLLQKKIALKTSIGNAVSKQQETYWKAQISDIDHIVDEPKYYPFSVFGDSLFNSFSLYYKVSKSYDTSSITSLLVPERCKVSLYGNTVFITTDNDKVLMEIQI